MSLEIEQVTGLVLAGGQSRRMGRRDKAFLDLAGRPLLAHILNRLRPQAGRLVISSNADTSLFAPFGLPVVADTIPGFAGPLAGVLAGLRWSAANAAQTRYVVSAPTDTPFLPGDLVSRLLAVASGRPGAIAIAASGGVTHPVVALWPVSIAAEIEAALGSGERKVHDFVLRHDALTVEFPFLERAGLRMDPFFNANTPEELAAARSFLQAKNATPIIGIAGWKNSGKTTLVASLVAELTRRGVRIATIKHAHHDLRLDDGETDSARHARAGAAEVAVVSQEKWALGEEVFEGPAPSLHDVTARLGPCDLILVEGYKSAPIPKIEVRRRDQLDKRSLARDDPLVIAIAADHKVDEVRLPLFPLDDIGAIANFIEQRMCVLRS